MTVIHFIVVKIRNWLYPEKYWNDLTDFYDNLIFELERNS